MMNADELSSVVSHAQTGDLDAYGEIVRRFQDMACGYAYSILGDFQWAEDAAQEAFIQAHRDLEKLRKPAAFPGWFRQIVFKHCDRITRRKQAAKTPLQAAAAVASHEPDPSQLAEKREMKDAVLAAIQSLSEDQRTVTTLFYINGYSEGEIAEFLEEPLSTVDHRLRASRRRLKERMISMVEDELKGARPGPEFREGVLRGVSCVEVRPEVAEQWGQVLLVAEDGRCTLIWIGKTEEAAIRRALKGEAPPRPLTHELLINSLRSFGARIKEAHITKIEKPTFYAELLMEKGRETNVIDCRPSDAIALAAMEGVPIRVAEDILATAYPRHADGSRVKPEDVWDWLKEAEDLRRKVAEKTAHISQELAELAESAFDGLVAKVGLGRLRLAIKHARSPARSDTARQQLEKARLRLGCDSPQWTAVSHMPADSARKVLDVQREVQAALSHVRNRT